jgi:hypothetical protein
MSKQTGPAYRVSGVADNVSHTLRTFILPTFQAPMLLALLAAGMFAGTARATAISSTASGGNWTAPGTWAGGVVPGAADDVTIVSGATVTMDTAAQKTVTSLTINGTLTHTAGSAYKIDLVVTPGNVTVNGTISVLGCGYAAGTGPSGYAGSLHYGGAHGGEGGTMDAYLINTPATGLPTRPTYDSVTNPTMAGGGGGGVEVTGFPGGGVVIISCNGDVTINAPGTIIADGRNGDVWCGGGPGAGGTVNISAVRLLGTGSISANGGLASPSNTCKPPGGGGGGRIAVVLSGDTVASIPVTLSARGGNGQSADRGYGAAGTIYLKGTGSINGSLKIANPVTLGASGAKTLLPAGTHQFDSISIDGGGAILAVGSGVTLNLDGCTVTTTGGGKVVKQGTGALNWTGTYTNTYTISQQGNGTWTLPGDLVVGTGGALTHEPRWLRTEDASSWLNIDIGAHNLTVGPGTISVAGCGDYDSSGSTSGGVHGGEGGGPRTPTYGSITNPVTAGGGAGNWVNAKGGGVVVIQGTGIVTVDATKQINAVGGSGSAACGDGGGAGGSVNLRVGQLLGSGTITVKGGNDRGDCGIGSGGGGGRIAVVLSSATVASIPVTLNAEGASGSVGYGAAGTIYLQGTDSPDGKGLLRISNPTLTGVAGATTLISADTSVGHVELLNQAKLKIDANRTLSVFGSWSNAVAVVNGANLWGQGTVELAGASAASVWGSTTWYNLTITNARKVVSFQAGATQTINLSGTPKFDNYVTLQSTTNQAWWYLTKGTSGGGTQNVGNVCAKDSNASNGWTFVAARGTDLGNSRNWRFPPKGTVVVFK